MSTQNFCHVLRESTNLCWAAHCHGPGLDHEPKFQLEITACYQQQQRPALKGLATLKGAKLCLARGAPAASC